MTGSKARTAVLASVVAVVATGGAMISSGPPDPPVVAVERSSMTIEAPDTVAAGDSIDVRITGVEPGTELEVVVDGGYGARRFVIVPAEGAISLELPPADRPESGRLLLLAAQPGRFGATSFDVLPGPPVDPLVSYLGPRTIVADGEHRAMIVAVPLDAVGNPVAAGTSVEYRITRPGGESETVTTSTSDLIGYQVIPSAFTAGTTRVAPAAGRAAGPERELLEVAGRPQPFELEPTGPLPPADGRSLTVLRTSALVDRYGNTIPDGVVVTLDLTGSTGRRKLYGVSVDGSAEFTVEAPSRPGPARAIASTSGTRSEPLTIRFAPALTTFPVSIETVDVGRQVVIGPVRSTTGAYVPDATTATVRASGFEQHVPLDSGSATLLVPADVTGPISVRILGADMAAS